MPINHEYPGLSKSGYDSPSKAYDMTSYKIEDSPDVLSSMQLQAGNARLGALLFINIFGAGGSAISDAPNLENLDNCLAVALEPTNIEKLNWILRNKKEAEEPMVGRMYGEGIVAQLVQFAQKNPIEADEIGIIFKQHFDRLQAADFEKDEDDFARNQIAGGVIGQFIDVSIGSRPVQIDVISRLRQKIQPQGFLVDQINQKSIKEVYPYASQLERLIIEGKLQNGSPESFSRLSHQLLSKAVKLQSQRSEFPLAATMNTLLTNVSVKGKKHAANFEKLFKFMNLFQKDSLSGLETYKLSELRKISYDSQTLATDRIMFIVSVSDKEIISQSRETQTARTLGHCARMFAEQAAGVSRSDVSSMISKRDLTIRYPFLQPSQSNSLVAMLHEGMSPRQIHKTARSFKSI